MTTERSSFGIGKGVHHTAQRFSEYMKTETEPRMLRHIPLVKELQVDRLQPRWWRVKTVAPFIGGVIFILGQFNTAIDERTGTSFADFVGTTADVIMPGEGLKPCFNYYPGEGRQVGPVYLNEMGWCDRAQAANSNES